MNLKHFMGTEKRFCCMCITKQSVIRKYYFMKDTISSNQYFFISKISRIDNKVKFKIQIA